MLITSKVNKTMFNNTVAHFYVKDYLTAEKSERYFTVNNGKEFARALLGGNVTELKTFGDKLIITISDGTGGISCMLAKDRSKLPETINADYAKLSKPADLISQAIGIVTSSTKKLLDRTYCEDLKPGEFVRVLGKVRFSEIFGNYIFIDQIERIRSVDEQMDYYNSIRPAG